jgi:arylsulfatase A-like enzyme
MNIILITADQMRADAMGCAGNPAVLSPNLDALAAAGTRMDRAYCVNPICSPSRTSLFTGRYPHATGVWNNGIPLSKEEVTLCDYLKPLGYRCVANGKMHFRPQLEPKGQQGRLQPTCRSYREEPRRDGTFYGFDEHHMVEDIGPSEYMDWLAEQYPDFAPKGLFRPQGPQIQRDGSDLPPEAHPTRWVGDRSVETVENHDTSRPLFMWMSFVDPHHPFDAPKKYVDMYRGREIPDPIGSVEDLAPRPEHLLNPPDGYWPGGAKPHGMSPDRIRDIRRNYFAMVTFLDEQVGRVIQALKQRGMYENSLIIFSADHGELLGDHGLLTKGPFLYESLIRIPMLFAGPGVRADTCCDALMENVDVLPTLLEMLGRDVPYGVQGRSQKSVLDGTCPNRRESALCSFDIHDDGLRLKSLVTPGAKLTLFTGRDFGELFDLEQDPQERRNRFDDPDCEKLQADLMRRLARRMMMDEDSLPRRERLW